MKLSSITSAVSAFLRSVGNANPPAVGEALLSSHLEDLNGRPLALVNGQATNALQYGLPLVLQNDGNALLARGDRFGGIATATIQPLFSLLIEGTTINGRLLSVSASSMAMGQTQSGITINLLNNLTASAYMQLSTLKQCELHMKAPLLMRMRMRVTQWGIANASADFGFALASASMSAAINLTGAYWRMDAAGVMPVLAINGVVVALGNDISSTLLTANFYHWGLIKDDDAWIFTVQNSSTGVVLSRQTLQVPAGQQKAFGSSHAQPYVRAFNSSTAPIVSTQLIVTEWTIGMLDTNMNQTASQIATGMGLGSEVSPTFYSSTSNLGNSTVPATTVPTNTTATTTALDGSVRIAAPAGATTDLALFSYTVPSPYRYRCKRVLIALKNLGAIVATTPTQVDLFLAVNGLGVSLSSNVVRKYLGTQTFAVGAAIGQGAIEGPISLDFSECDLITEAGRTLILIARISTGTATALQVLEVMYSNLGHFE